MLTRQAVALFVCSMLQAWAVSAQAVEIDFRTVTLVENEQIQLRIEGVFEDRTVASTTHIVEPPFLVFPQSGDKLGLIPGKSIGLGWNPRENSEIYTALFHVNITETLNDVDTQKRLSWVVTENTDKRMIDADGEQFFSFLADNLEKNELIRRDLNSLEFELISGNSEIAEYIRVGQANLGITSSGEIPVLSNISNGLGVFAATHTHVRVNLVLNGESQDSLVSGRLTRDLNFN